MEIELISSGLAIFKLGSKLMLMLNLVGDSLVMCYKQNNEIFMYEDKLL